MADTPSASGDGRPRPGSRRLPSDVNGEAPVEHAEAAREWLVPGVTGPPRVGGRRPPPELAVRVRRLESKLADEIEATHRAVGRKFHALTNHVEELSARVEALEGGAAPSQDRERPRGRAGTLNINELGFEDLRELGLSVNLAARLISQREVRGGFKSLDELDELWGFPRQEIAELKRAVSI